MRSPHKLLSPSTVTTENNQVFGFNAPSPLTVSSSSTAVTTLFYSPRSIPEQPEAEFTNGHAYNHTHNDVGGELEYQKKEVRFLTLFHIIISFLHYFFRMIFQRGWLLLLSKRLHLTRIRDYLHPPIDHLTSGCRDNSPSHFLFQVMFDDFHNVKCIIINFPNQNSIYLFIVALYGSTINNNNNLLGIYHFFYFK